MSATPAVPVNVMFIPPFIQYPFVGGLLPNRLIGVPLLVVRVNALTIFAAAPWFPALTAEIVIAHVVPALDTAACAPYNLTDDVATLIVVFAVTWNCLTFARSPLFSPPIDEPLDAV